MATNFTIAQHWAEAHRQWLESYPAECTSHAYRQAWKSLRSFTGKEPWQVSQDDVAGWQARLWADGFSPSTIRVYLAGISSFYTYAMNVYAQPSPDGDRQPLCRSNPAAGLPRPRPDDHRRCLSAAEARLLLGAIPPATVQGRRDYALVLAFLLTGRRSREILYLRLADFFHDGRRTWYRWLDKGYPYCDEYPPQAWQAILRYLEAAGRLPDDGGYIFAVLNDYAGRLPTVRERLAGGDLPLSQTEAARLVKKYARRSGLDQAKVTVHTLRYTAARLRAEAGDDLEAAPVRLDPGDEAALEEALGRLEAPRDSLWAGLAALLKLDPPPGPTAAGPAPDRPAWLRRPHNRNRRNRNQG